MTASAAPVTTKPANRSGLWAFLRLLGGWLMVALLGYLLWNPSAEFGWLKMLFTWVLLTILADEFGGWFGYIALVLGVLPLLMKTPPEQWFIVLPLVGAALFALLIMKHSGGPFVLPFGAALFAGTLIGADKVGAKLDPSLKLVHDQQFQKMALLAMALGVGFSFFRQLGSMIYRWQQRRKLAPARAKAAKTAPAAALASEPETILTTPPTDLQEVSSTPARAEPNLDETGFEESVTLLPAGEQSDPEHAVVPVVDLQLAPQESDSGAVPERPKEL